MRVGQARRRDANEADIVEALERIGAVVFRLSAPGAPDLLVAWRGRWTPMEIKSETGTLTPLQVIALSENGCPIVRTVDEAFAVIGALG